MHKYFTYVVKLLLSHDLQYTRGTYLLSQNIPGVYFDVCEKMPATMVNNSPGLFMWCNVIMIYVSV